MTHPARRRAAPVLLAAWVLAGCTTALRSDPDPLPTAAPSTPAADVSAPVPPPAPATAAAADPGVALADLATVEPVPLDPPEFGREPPATAGSGGLTVVSSQPNDVVDTDAWLRDNGLEPTRLAPEQADADVPRDYRGTPLAAVLRSADTDFLLYGAQFEPTLLVAVAPDTRRVRYAFDFAGYAQAPQTAPGEDEYVRQAVRWARQVDRVLYVSTAHRTYARSSGGMNAYVTAIDVDTRAVLWRSAPLVSNSDTFEVVGDRVVTGYGFTAEPDRLYALDTATGAVAGSLATHSAPEIVRERDGRLLVRCYDTDYVVTLDR